MLTSERQNVILERLQEKKAVTVSELTEILNASESTIRRDLSVLNKMGKLNKVHGGATVLTDVLTKEEDIPTKSQQNMQEKKRIAKYAASLIRDDDFIYIDAGTTTWMMTEAITNTKATYVTNAIVHAQRLTAKGCKTYVIGGQLKPVTEALVGTEALDSLKKFNFTKCFMGANGITAQRGVTTPDIEEAIVKIEAVKRTFMAYILADHTKFGKISSVTFADLDKVCIITDELKDKTLKDYTVIKEVQT